MSRPIINLNADSVADYVRTLLNKNDIYVSDLKAEFLRKNVPDMVIAFINLGMSPVDDGCLQDSYVEELFTKGRAISEYIDRELADDHPTDKRFLLRHMELLCLRYGLKQHKSTGFGHDVIFSLEPIESYYPKFDNSLYVPPLTGHWALATKGAARD